MPSPQSEDFAAEMPVAIPKIVASRWIPFPGAYMAPVPEAPATSAITIANQIPAEVLANIPAEQREAYREQWPLMTQEQRKAVTDTYGSAQHPMNENPPEWLLVAMDATPSGRASLLQLWPMITEQDRQWWLTESPQAKAAGPMQAGIGGAGLLLLAAIPLYFMFFAGKKRGRKR